MSCCMCEPMETAQSLGDDTHAVGHTAKVGTRARATQRVLCVLVSVGCKPGPSIGARDKDSGYRERKTPTPCATYRQRERGRKEERKKERKTERQKDRKTEREKEKTKEREKEKKNKKKKKEKRRKGAKENKRKREKEKHAFCRSCAWPCVGGSPKPSWTWTARPACTTTPGRRTRSAPRTGTLPSRKPKSGAARARFSGSRRRQHPQRNPFLGDAAAPAAGAAAPTATTVPAMPSATELSYLRFLAAGLLRKPPPTA